MEEKELVPAKSVHDDLLEAFRGAAHANDLSVLKLSDIPHDSLVPALKYIMNVMQTIHQKYGELKELSHKIDTVAENVRAEMEKRITSLEESVAKAEEALKNKEKEAESARSKFPLWVTLLCWFLALFQLWPGIIAYFCFRSHFLLFIILFF